MATELKATDGYHIYGWMRTALDLKGSELEAFAIVYSFSQSGAGIYRGGVNYLANWMGCARNTALHALKNLVEAELITEHPFEVNNVKFCNYTANYSKIEGVVQKLQGGSAKIAHINRSINRIENIDVSISNDISTSNKRESRNTSQKFTIPSAAEVQAYCDQRNNGISGEEFCDFYASKGWKVGTTPMKDWQAAVRTWERSRAQKAAPKAAPKKESVFEHNAKVVERLAARFSPEARAQAAAILNPTKQ